MDFLLKFIILGGQYLTKIAAKSLLEAYKRSILLGNSINQQYEHALCMAGSYENILDMFNTNLNELRSNSDMHLAFISERHKKEFEEYLQKQHNLDKEYFKHECSMIENEIDLSSTEIEDDLILNIERIEKILLDTNFDDGKPNENDMFNLTEYAKLIKCKNSECNLRVNENFDDEFYRLEDFDKELLQNVAQTPSFSKSVDALWKTHHKSVLRKRKSKRRLNNYAKLLEMNKIAFNKLEERFRKEMFEAKMKDLNKEVELLSKQNEINAEFFQRFEDDANYRLLKQRLQTIENKVKQSVNVINENYKAFCDVDKLIRCKESEAHGSDVCNVNNEVFRKVTRGLTHKMLMKWLEVPQKASLIPLPTRSRIDQMELSNYTSLIDINRKAFDELESQMNVVKIIGLGAAPLMSKGSMVKKEFVRSLRTNCPLHAASNDGNNKDDDKKNKLNKQQQLNIINKSFGKDKQMGALIDGIDIKASKEGISSKEKIAAMKSKISFIPKDVSNDQFTINDDPMLKDPKLDENVSLMDIDLNKSSDPTDNVTQDAKLTHSLQNIDTVGSNLKSATINETKINDSDYEEDYLDKIMHKIINRNNKNSSSFYDRCLQRNETTRSECQLNSSGFRKTHDLREYTNIKRKNREKRHALLAKEAMNDFHPNKLKKNPEFFKLRMNVSPNKKSVQPEGKLTENPENPEFFKWRLNLSPSKKSIQPEIKLSENPEFFKLRLNLSPSKKSIEPEIKLSEPRVPSRPVSEAVTKLEEFVEQSLVKELEETIAKHEAAKKLLYANVRLHNEPLTNNFEVAQCSPSNHRLWNTKLRCNEHRNVNDEFAGRLRYKRIPLVCNDDISANLNANNEKSAVGIKVIENRKNEVDLTNFTSIIDDGAKVVAPAKKVRQKQHHHKHRSDGEAPKENLHKMQNMQKASDTWELKKIGKEYYKNAREKQQFNDKMAKHLKLEHSVAQPARPKSLAEENGKIRIYKTSSVYTSRKSISDYSQKHYDDDGKKQVSSTPTMADVLKKEASASVSEEKLLQRCSTDSIEYLNQSRINDWLDGCIEESHRQKAESKLMSQSELSKLKKLHKKEMLPEKPTRMNNLNVNNHLGGNQKSTINSNEYFNITVNVDEALPMRIDSFFTNESTDITTDEDNINIFADLFVDPSIYLDKKKENIINESNVCEKPYNCLTTKTSDDLSSKVNVKSPDVQQDPSEKVVEVKEPLEQVQDIPIKLEAGDKVDNNKKTLTEEAKKKVDMPAVDVQKKFIFVKDENKSVKLNDSQVDEMVDKLMKKENAIKTQLADMQKELSAKEPIPNQKEDVKNTERAPSSSSQKPPRSVKSRKMVKTEPKRRLKAKSAFRHLESHPKDKTKIVAKNDKMELANSIKTVDKRLDALNTNMKANIIRANKLKVQLPPKMVDKSVGESNENVKNVVNETKANINNENVKNVVNETKANINNENVKNVVNETKAIINNENTASQQNVLKPIKAESDIDNKILVKKTNKFLLETNSQLFKKTLDNYKTARKHDDTIHTNKPIEKSEEIKKPLQLQEKITKSKMNTRIPIRISPASKHKIEESTLKNMKTVKKPFPSPVQLMAQKFANWEQEISHKKQYQVATFKEEYEKPEDESPAVKKESPSYRFERKAVDSKFGKPIIVTYLVKDEDKED